MIVNFILIFFLLFMALYWASQGFYSAFLHFCLVIVAGAIAFAFWEPVAMLLFNFIPRIAPVIWGIALLVPFLVVLSALRLIVDKLLPGNMQFMHAVSLVGGGFFGVASGILTAGLVIIGLGFLPLGASLAGYQPHETGPRGQVQSSDQRLWINADGIAAAVFTELSRNAFHPIGGRYTLAQAHPDLQQAAGGFRLQYDPLASLVALPESVRVDDVHSRETPIDDPALNDALDGRLERSGQRLVIVETTWTRATGTYDADGTLRVPPTQISLTTAAGRNEYEVHFPVAFTRTMGESATLYPIRDTRIQAHSSSSEAHIGWVFLIDADERPLFMRARNLRFDLPAEIDTDADAFAQAIGSAYVPDEEADDDAPRTATARDRDGRVGDREGQVAGHVATAITQTNSLPATFSRNHATGLTYEGSSVQRGSTDVRVMASGLTQHVRVDSLYQPSHLRMVRIQLSRDQARSLLGGARQAAREVTGISLELADGDHRHAVGYALLTGARRERRLVVRMDMTDEIRAASELPIRQMAGGDELYLYFHVPPNSRVVRYHASADTSHEIDMQIE